MVLAVSTLAPLMHVLVFYRVSLHLLNVDYDERLSNGNDPHFREIAGKISTSVTDLYSNVPGDQYVTIIRFR